MGTDRSRLLGASGLVVSPIGLGLAALGRPGYINVGHDVDLGADRDRSTMEIGAHAVLDAAYEAGVRYVDAARSYGSAEAFLASWLTRRAISVADVVIASKWGYTYAADWRVDAATHEVKDHSLPVFRRQLAESRTILGDHLAIYQIHSATLESGVLDDAAIIDALSDLRATGIRVGLTVSGPRQSETIWRALEVRRDGARVFDTVQATWNLLERSVERALAAAHEAGMGVIVKEAVANGRLTARGSKRHGETALAPLLTEARALDVAPDVLAIASAMSQPWADVVLSGATTATQLASNLRATALSLDNDTLDRLGTMAVDPSRYWLERSSLPWN